MQQGLVPITLPWKRPRKGLVVAELGATFQVEWTNRGWQVSVKSGKRTVTLARELTRQRDGQCRAEAYAAGMPEVLAAMEALAAESASEPEPRRKAASEPEPRRKAAETAASTSPPDTTDSPQPVATAPKAAALPFDKVEDGCICGRASSGTWAADPKGNVALPNDTPPEEADQIRRFAADYFGERAAPVAAPRRGRGPRFVPQAFKGTDAPPGPSPAALRDLQGGAENPPQAVAKKAAAKKAAAKKTAARAATPKTVAKAATPKTAAKAAAKKTAAKAAAKTAAKAAATDPPAANKSAAKKAATKKAAKVATQTAKAAPPQAGSSAQDRLAKARAAKAAKAGTAAQTAPPKAPREVRSKTKSKPGDPQPEAPAAASGPGLQWFDVEGRPRANTPFGSFAIDPEGDRQALYFYDLNGMSTFIADRGDLRQIAAERAARGGVRPNVSQQSPNLDAQMRNVFFAEDRR